MSALLDTIRSRFLYKSLDAAMTASLRPKRRFVALAQSVLDPRTSNYDRVASLVNMVDTVVPGLARRATSLICRPPWPPFSAERVELLAYGSGATVFLLEGESGRQVLKIYRRSLGVGPARRNELLGSYRQRYETIRSWYAASPDIVWPADFMILPGPILGRPAVACLQTYIEGEKKDALRGLSDNELVTALGASNGLRRQILAFAKQTRRIYRSQGRCADFLGENNLMLVRSGDRWRLHLIDYGVFDTDRMRRTPALSERIEGCIGRIESLAQKASASGSNCVGKWCQKLRR